MCGTRSASQNDDPPPLDVGAESRETIDIAMIYTEKPTPNILLDHWVHRMLVLAVDLLGDALVKGLPCRINTLSPRAPGAATGWQRTWTDGLYELHVLMAD